MFCLYGNIKPFIWSYSYWCPCHYYKTIAQKREQNPG